VLEVQVLPVAVLSLIVLPVAAWNMKPDHWLSVAEFATNSLPLALSPTTTNPSAAFDIPTFSLRRLFENVKPPISLLLEAFPVSAMLLASTTRMPTSLTLCGWHSETSPPGRDSIRGRVLRCRRLELLPGADRRPGRSGSASRPATAAQRSESGSVCPLPPPALRVPPTSGG
jgi:hypothetical protein